MDPLTPRDWELDALLTDGTMVHVRPITPGDQERLAAFHSRLSEQSTSMRYFVPHPVLTKAEIHHFTHVDYADRLAFIALLDENMVGVARYDRLAGTDEAEVAFVVEDAHQGRGVGMLLLELLAAAAYELGIKRFVAETLPNNRRMLRVFADAGFELTTRYGDGVIHIFFPTKPTDRTWEAIGAREQYADAQSMERLLRPRSVAVVGAGRDPASLGHRVFRNLLAAEFTGVVYPINPSATSVAGIRAYPSLRQLRDPVDLVVVAVPAPEVVGVAAQAAEIGAKGLVVLSAGFADTDGGEGAQRQRALLDVARSGGMRLVGPVSVGIANTDPAVALNATVAPSPLAHGRVGMLSQSGALGLALLERVRLLGLGISTFVSVGNKADVSGNDLLQFWETDAGTDIVVLYLESFGNPRKFARIARRISRHKPVVAVKSGRTGAGVGQREGTPEAAVDALFRQAGVIRVDTLSQLFDVAAVLAHQPLPAGPRVAVIANSGGALAVAADAVRAAELGLSRTEELHGWASATDYVTALDVALADHTVDSVIVLYAPIAGATPAEVAEVVAKAAARGSGKPIVPTFLGCEFRRDELHALSGQLTPFAFPEPAVHALARVTRHALWRHRPEGQVPALPGVDVAGGRACLPLTAEEYGTGELPEPTAVEMLSCFGIEVNPSAAVTGIATTVALVQDPSFGPILRFGLAGVPTELLGDVAVRILPLTDVDAAELVRAPAASPLLLDAAVDVAALEDLLLRVGRLAEEVPEVTELLLEPVIVGAAGAVATGVRVRLEPHQHRPAPLLRRLR